MKKYLLGGAMVLALVVGCGGSPMATSGHTTVDKHAQGVFDQINNLTGPDREAKLVEMAEKEGELSVYTSNTDLDSIVDAFTDKYKVDVNVYRGNSESVLQRVLQESKAGFAGVDLVETNAGELNVMNEEGLFYPYKGALRDAVRPEGQKDGWTADRFNVFVVAWNTKKVSKSEQPKTLEELAEPQWKGKISMEVGDVDWFTAQYQYLLDHGKTEAEADELFKKLAANAKIVKGHTVQTELLTAGQFGVALSVYSHTIDEGVDKGTPVQWRPSSGDPVQPIVIRPNGAGLVATAKHPAAAALFMDFLLTDGQKVIADNYRIGSVPLANDPLKGLETIPAPEEELMKNGKKWDAKYAALVQNSKSAE